MNNSHEIIINTRKDSNHPRVVQFSDLFDLRNDISTMLYLWTTNSYYIDVVSRTFIINGGRKIIFSDYKDCKILYRRRNQISYAVDGKEKPLDKKINWILGIEEIETKRMVLLIISEDGQFWEWANKL